MSRPDYADPKDWAWKQLVELVTNLLEEIQDDADLTSEEGGTRIVDALLACRVKCETCEGQGGYVTEEHVRLGDDQWELIEVSHNCIPCGGSGFGPPAVLEAMGMEQVGWAESPANTQHGYVLNIEPVKSDSQPVFRLVEGRG